MTTKAELRKSTPGIWAIHYNFIVMELGKWRENDSINLNQYAGMVTRLCNLLNAKLNKKL